MTKTRTNTPARAPAPAAIPDASREAHEQRPAWPETARRDVVDTYHGVEVHDPYRWLEQADDPEVKAWTNAQDQFARAQLAQLPGRAALATRLAELCYVESETPPERRGKRYFYSHQHKDKEKAVYYVREGEHGEPRVLLDPNTMSEDGSVSIKGISYSYDGKLVAYRVSHNNADESILHVLQVDSGRVSELDSIPGVRYSDASWTPNSDAFYYTRLPMDASIKPADRAGYAQVYRHQIGKPYQEDSLIYDKTGDPSAFVGGEISRDGHFLFVYVVHGWTSTDVYVRELPHDKTFRPLVVGVPARFYATGWKGKIYVHTNYQAERWRMLRIDDLRKLGHDPQSLGGFREIVPEDSEAVLDGYGVIGNHLSLHYLKRAHTLLKIATLDGKPVREVELPGIGTAVGLFGNPEDDTAYFSFESFLQAPTVYRTSVRRGGNQPYFAMQVPADATPYGVEQLQLRSKDGTELSMFVVARKELVKDGSTPFLMLGYGGFNISVQPRFEGEYFAWLEAGGGVAFVNLRGGGEYGEAWHRAGMLTHKQNVFDDFIASAEHLIEQKYTSAAKLAIRGGSNGGLLVGAAMTQRPELFRAVVCRVPLLDMLRYPQFGTAKAWTGEYGTPDDAEQFRALYAYSPYHHVREHTDYPALLMMSADSDDRVDPMHARKFVAAVQHASNHGDHPAWLRIEARAGHGGADMLAQKVAAETDEYAFLFAQLGMTTR